MKSIIIFCFLFLFISTNAQLRKLSIKKNEKEKFAYSLGFPIKILTVNDAIISGNIHVIKKDTIQLNIFDKIAIRDIKSIEPIISNTLTFQKIRSVNEALVGALISTTAIATFQPDLLADVWIHKNEKLLNGGYNFDYNKLTRKQKRKLRKKWSSEEYKFVPE